MWILRRKPKEKKKKRLYDFIWHAYCQTVIFPLLFIEALLVVSFFAANRWVTEEMRGHVMEQADEQLTETARLQAELINAQIHDVASDTVLLAEALSRALKKPAALSEEDRRRLVMSPEGQYYTTSGGEGVSVYYNGLVPVREAEKQKVARVLSVEDLIVDVAKHNELIASAYFISWDGLSVYYPYLDPLTRFLPRVDYTQYGFYSRTGPEHNPERKLHWTTAYSSYSGLGYMISAVAPVYVGDRMEGIFGTDMLVGNITEQIEEMDTPWDGYAILIGNRGQVMAVPDKARADWGIDVPSNLPANWAAYLEQRINIHSTEFSELITNIIENEQGFSKVTVRGEPRVLAWHTVAETGWKLLVVVSEKNMYEKVYAVSDTVNSVGLTLSAISLLFFVIFAEVQRLRCERYSLNATRSLMSMNHLIKRIAQGDYYQTAPEAETYEIDETLGLIVEMGRRLGEVNKSLVQMNSEIRQKEAYLKAALSSVDDFLLEAGRDGAGLHAVVRGPVEETEDFKRLFNWLGTDGSPIEARTAAAINQVIDTGEPMLLDYEIPTRYGKRWYIARFARIDVEPPRVIISVRDNTKRIEMEQSIIRARDAAEAASRAKSQFLSNMSHELRTPLNAILGFAQILEMGGAGELTQAQREYAGEIISAGQHLLGLINGVLDLARVESGKIRLSFGPVDVRAVVEEAVTIALPIAEQSRVTVQVEDTPDIVMHTDGTRLKQILLNLLTNAIKYNKPGGTVRCSCALEGETVRFTVEDTGIGMRKEELEEIFSPFTRLERSSNLVEGTGVGLAIVRQLTQLLGGKVRVESTFGEGSRFTVELPLRHEAREETREREILHVTTSRASRLALARAIRQRPDIRIAAASPEEAVELIREMEPQVVLVDCPAGEIRPEVIASMKKLAAKQRFVLAAVNSQEETRRNAPEDGFDAVISTPVTERAVLSLFERFA